MLPKQAPLVGAVGQEYVHSVLSSLDPAAALREVQRRGALRCARADPLLRLLDSLGLPRCAWRALHAASAPTCSHRGCCSQAIILRGAVPQTIM
jgi:hypothetical protein